jgi:hypothetical protein
MKRRRCATRVLSGGKLSGLRSGWVRRTALESQIAESPSIFVQAVALAYKRSDAGELCCEFLAILNRFRALDRDVDAQDGA